MRGVMKAHHILVQYVGGRDWIKEANNCADSVMITSDSNLLSILITVMNCYHRLYECSILFPGS